MGAYVNPGYTSKEDWLNTNGVELVIGDYSWEEIRGIFGDRTLPVILMDNGMFTAAGIAYDEREFNAFLDPDDKRPKRLYVCDINDLLKVSRELNVYLEPKH